MKRLYRHVGLVRKIKFILLSFLFLLLTSIPAYSEGEVLFQVKPDQIPYFSSDQIISYWNPKKSPEIHSPGLKVLFFGKAEGCFSDAKNGPIKIYLPPLDIDVENLTGVSIGQGGKLFVPTQNEELCNVKGRPLEGGSFVYINQEPQKGGIGLFTASGKDEKGSYYFFQTRDSEGVGGGVNKFQKSTAITWRLQYEMYPFKGKKNLIIYVKSSVETFSQVQDRSEPIQIRQQLEVGFANKSCLKEKDREKTLCLNKYVFDFLVKRWGGKPLDKKRGAIIFIDRAQGNLPHISIYSKPKGEKIREKFSGLEVATSCGEGLQEEIFKDKTFCYKISWEQFQNALLSIAANKLNKKDTSLITREDMEKLFGKNFDNPGEWYLTVISIQHELHDPYKDRNVFIGGNVKEIKVMKE